MGDTSGGTGALTKITTSIDNTAYGNFALANDTTGGRNTALGEEALVANIMAVRTRASEGTRSD